MYYCEKCGSVYFKNKPDVCSCGEKALDFVKKVDILEYMCDSCKSQYREARRTCKNCGSEDIKCINKKQIIEVADTDCCELSSGRDISNYLLIVLYGMKYFILLFIVVILIGLAIFRIPELIKYSNMPKTNDSIEIENRIRQEVRLQIILIPVLSALFVVINHYLKNKNNYFKKLSNSYSKLILIKNVDYEIMPQKTMFGIKYRVLARLVTVGEVAIIKASKELFDNPQGEYSLLIDMNNMDNYLIRKDIPIKS